MDTIKYLEMSQDSTKRQGDVKMEISELVCTNSMLQGMKGYQPTPGDLEFIRMMKEEKLQAKIKDIHMILEKNLHLELVSKDTEKATFTQAKLMQEKLQTFIDKKRNELLLMKRMMANNEKKITEEIEQLEKTMFGLTLEIAQQETQTSREIKNEVEARVVSEELGDQQQRLRDTTNHGQPRRRESPDIETKHVEETSVENNTNKTVKMTKTKAKSVKTAKSKQKKLEEPEDNSKKSRRGRKKPPEVSAPSGRMGTELSPEKTAASQQGGVDEETQNPALRRSRRLAKKS
ncbi:uncharacterized protein LOC103389233 [Cynoglossus semilaevis]|uniref:uncharacterized protein LOC103389233 n=1 Tax=Cynoglossus semilaevis TaxID=244447 RepID=UPI000496A19C|nr:uncharacterized protein LOC103389233 [Cynoglossus semilaevis]XP_024918257.1 uncharacterized protein LOC103389233 [Cynoglossus semilaevis]